MIKRINLRGREFEQPKNDPGLVSYYNRLLDEYDKFFNGGYNASPILIIDGDKYDFVDNEEDREEVLNQISDKLKSIGLLDSSFVGKEYSRNQVDNMLDKVQSVIV
jgi:deoxyadenosine/deoxycytidine kinase